MFRKKTDSKKSMQEKEEHFNNECECGSACKCGAHCDCNEPEITEEVQAQEEVSELTKALDEATKNKDLYIRAVADLDTYRRKVQREKLELAKFAQQPLVEELLPSIDHLDMAISAAKDVQEAKDLVAGVDMVSKQMKKVLENFGVESISRIGEDFDPNLEECVAHKASEEFQENKVMELLRVGYKLNGRLIRPASVVVSSGGAK